MPDTPVAPQSGAPYDPVMEVRVSRLEERAARSRMEAAIVRIEAKLDATLPHLATKVDLAEKPSKTYMWGILTVLLTAYACGLAGLAILK